MDVDGTSFRQRDRVWCPMLFRSGVGGGDDDMRVGSHGGRGGGDHGDAWWKRALSGNLHAGKQSLRGNRGSGHVLVGRGAGRGVVRSVGLVYLQSGGTFVAFTSSVHKILRARQSISFYLWSLSLTIVTGRTVFFIMQQDSKDYGAEILMAIAALVLCIAQFALGRRIGKKYGETIAGGQGLGQKNTILAIWMAQVYLSPLSSIGPAAYVLWQNSINAFQLYRKRNTAGGVKDER